MSERYTKLFSLPENLYAAGSPVIIVAGALLKDNQTDKVIGQLKIRCISEKRIQAAKVRLDLLDTAGSPVGEPVVYEYLDLSTSENTEFGQKTPIRIPYGNARAYKAAVTEVVFSDKTVWTSGEPWEALPAPSLLPIDDSELRRQYQLRFGGNSQYEVLEEKDLWCCTCGTWNRRGKNCAKCGNAISSLQAVDMAQLDSEKDIRLAEETERKAAENAKNAAKKKMMLIGASICAAVLISIAVVYRMVTTSPAYIAKQTIQEGFTYYENEDFYGAESTWKTVEMQFVEKNTLNEPIQPGASGQAGYKPTAEELMAHGESLFYEYACHIAHRSFAEAIPYFERIPDYEDSAAIAENMQTLLDRYLGEYQCISHWYQYEGYNGLGDKEDQKLYENFTVSGMYFSGDGMFDIRMDYDFGGTPLYPYGESYNVWNEELYLDGWDSPWEYDYTFSADGRTFTAITTFNADKGDLVYTAVWRKIPNQ